MQDLAELIEQVRPETAALLRDIALQDLADERWNAQLGSFLTSDGVARLLGRDGQPLSRQAVSKRRGLLSIRTGSGAVVYPAFQFAGRRPLPGLATVLEILSDAAQPLTIASWLTSPHPDLDGRTPVEALRQGEEFTVARAARALAAGLAA